MKKKLLLLCVPIMLFSANLDAQVKYWDFGAKDLGSGYDNMLPEFYLNAFSNYLRNIDLTYEGQVFTVPDGFVDESGESKESIYFATFNDNYSNYQDGFTLSSKGSAPNPPNGTLLSGSSEYTKPKNLPDLDGSTDMVFYKDSNSDRLLTINKDLTRYDERTGMPDDINESEYTGAIQFTTPGDKRYNDTRFRGFLMNLTAGQYLTVVGSGQYVDIEGDGTLGCSTGWFSFESYGGTGTPVTIENKGSGTGASDCGGLTGGNRGDEAVRVMEFQAVDAGQYRLAYRGGTVRVYRMYVSNSSIKNEIEATLGIEDIKTNNSPNVKAIGNRIYLSNISEKTEVNIYSITGALVKSIETSSDTNFEFRTGVWIASLKTKQGQKSVKLITH